MIRSREAASTGWGFVIIAAVLLIGAGIMVVIGRESFGAGRVVLYAVFVLPLVACGLWVVRKAVRALAGSLVLEARVTGDGVKLSAPRPGVQRPVTVSPGTRLRLTRVDEARDNFASWQHGVYEYELAGGHKAWRVDSPIPLTSAMVEPLRALLARQSIELEVEVSREAGDQVPVASAVLPGQPQDVVVTADMGQGALRAYRSADAPRKQGVPSLGAPIAWNSSAPTTIRVTVDRPEYFNPDSLPAWDLPKPADMLAIDEFGGPQQAAVPVPGGFSEIHAFVMRKGVKPRVVIYLKPLSDTQDH